MTALNTRMALYSDFKLSFTPDPITGDLAKVEDDDSVVQSVQTLILTMFFERVFQPGLGSLVTAMLFEPLDRITAASVASTIRDTIRVFEPRAEVSTVEFYFDKTPKGELIPDHSVFLDISLRVRNIPTLVTTGVLLRRLR